MKGERTEWAVQKLVELGIDAVIPFVADRSVVRWDPARSEHQHRSAGEGRTPGGDAESPIDGCRRSNRFVLVRRGRGAGGVALADADGSPPSLTWPNIVVGPEGGWSEAERGTGRSGECGWRQTVLRAETAAVAAGAVLVALREGSGHSIG